MGFSLESPASMAEGATMGAARAIAMFLMNGVEAARSVMTSVVSSGASTEATPAPLSSEPKTKDA